MLKGPEGEDASNALTSAEAREKAASVLFEVKEECPLRHPQGFGRMPAIAESMAKEYY